MWCSTGYADLNTVDTPVRCQKNRRNTDAKKTHKQIYDTCMWKHRKTHMFWQSRLARRAVNCCHDGPGHGWCRYSPQRLRIRSWPLTSTLQHQDNSLWFWHCNIKTMTPRLITAYNTLPLEILTGHPYETRHISHLLLPKGEVRGASWPKLFVLLLIFWAKNMHNLAIKK